VVDVRLAADDVRVVALVGARGRHERAAARLGPLAGPRSLRALLERACNRAQRVPAADVLDWGPAAIEIRRRP